MNFNELAVKRQSCRKYDPDICLDESIINKILETSILSPSACNGQPYKIHVCLNEKAKAVAKCTQSMGMNKFATDAPVMLVISEDSYVKTASIGATIKNNDYRSIDIGILSAYITAAATEYGVSSCILGWFDDKKIREICHIDTPVRLVICLGVAASEDVLRTKKRKNFDSLITFVR